MIDAPTCTIVRHARLHLLGCYGRLELPSRLGARLPSGGPSFPPAGGPLSAVEGFHIWGMLPTDIAENCKLPFDSRVSVTDAGSYPTETEEIEIDLRP